MVENRILSREVSGGLDIIVGSAILPAPAALLVRSTGRRGLGIGQRSEEEKR